MMPFEVHFIEYQEFRFWWTRHKVVYVEGHITQYCVVLVKIGLTRKCVGSWGLWWHRCWIDAWCLMVVVATKEMAITVMVTQKAEKRTVKKNGYHACDTSRSYSTYPKLIKYILFTLQCKSCWKCKAKNKIARHVRAFFGIHESALSSF